MPSIDSISLTNGVLPIAVVALGLGAVAMSFRWRDETWKQQLLLGVPITGAVVGLAAILVDGLALIPYQFPNSYYLWVGLVLLSVVVSIIGWRRFRNWRRVVSASSVVLTMLMAFVLINKEYQYYPTVGSVLGVNAQNQVSEKKLDELRKANQGVLPTHGFTIQEQIPGVVSHFVARPAYIWVPPAWIASTAHHLPVIELLPGSPGETSDWTRAGFADQIARRFAEDHNGIAPILVMPDPNGSVSGDTECVDSPRGRAETYLTVDVPKYMQKTFGASTAAGSMVIAGVSAGGFCALMLALRHPALYPSFGDFEGLSSPTVAESVAKEQTTQALFGGSSEIYEQHNPPTLLTRAQYRGLSGWFVVGTGDPGPLAAQRQLVPLARSAGISTCAREIPGGDHGFAVAVDALRDSLPWMSFRLGLTPRPSPSRGQCEQ